MGKDALSWVDDNIVSLKTMAGYWWYLAGEQGATDGRRYRSSNLAGCYLTISRLSMDARQKPAWCGRAGYATRHEQSAAHSAGLSPTGQRRSAVVATSMRVMVNASVGRRGRGTSVPVVSSPAAAPAAKAGLFSASSAARVLCLPAQAQPSKVRVAGWPTVQLVVWLQKVLVRWAGLARRRPYVLRLVG
jgi:hypothetical protein